MRSKFVTGKGPAGSNGPQGAPGKQGKKPQQGERKNQTRRENPRQRVEPSQFGTCQECRYLVKDFGTSQSPKSTRQRDSRYCPDR
ncbi:MAG: hypothetical protein G8D58_00415, partial [gamma proteobacterium symbiont of Phacoides pectinatus]